MTVYSNNNEITLFNRQKKRIRTDDEELEPIVKVGEFQESKMYVPASQASLELHRVKGTWPFDLLPDEMIIEEKRIIIKQRTFPFYTSTITIPIDKILMFEVTHSIFFSSIFLRGYIGYNVDCKFGWLNHQDAQEVKDIVDGIRLSKAEHIKINENNVSAIKAALQKLGHAY